jgi:phosphate transport system permease protein
MAHMEAPLEPGPVRASRRGESWAAQRGVIPDWAPMTVVAAATGLAILVAYLAGFNFAFPAVAGAIVGGISVYAWSRVVEGRRRAADRAVTISVTSAFALALVPLASLLVTVIQKGVENFDAAWFTESQRNVIGEGGGAVHAIIGTLVITAVAGAISIPIGILAAIYLVEYGGGTLARVLTFFVDVMTGIPSIVAGLFAYAVFSLIFGPGIRLGIMGSIALSVLMIPIVVRATEEMLRIVPNKLREASYALGVPKWRTIVKVVLPTALVGIVTGVMMAIARVIGETAPLLITVGVIASSNWNPFEGRMASLPVFTYEEYRNPGVPPEPSIARAWGAALTLIIMVLLLYVTARAISRRYGTEVRR